MKIKRNEERAAERNPGGGDGGNARQPIPVISFDGDQNVFSTVMLESFGRSDSISVEIKRKNYHFIFKRTKDIQVTQDQPLNLEAVRALGHIVRDGLRPNEENKGLILNKLKGDYYLSPANEYTPREQLLPIAAGSGEFDCVPVTWQDGVSPQFFPLGLAGNAIKVKPALSTFWAPMPLYKFFDMLIGRNEFTSAFEDDRPVDRTSIMHINAIIQKSANRNDKSVPLSLKIHMVGQDDQRANSRPKQLPLEALKEAPVTQEMFSLDGVRTSLYDYYNKDTAKLKKQNFPSIKVTNKNMEKMRKEDLRPLEMMWVSPLQEIDLVETMSSEKGSKIFNSSPPFQQLRREVGSADGLKEKILKSKKDVLSMIQEDPGKQQRIFEDLTKLTGAPNINIGPMKEVTGRRLELPQIAYYNDEVVPYNPSGGDWQTLGVKAIEGQNLNLPWAVVQLAEGPQDGISSFVNRLRERINELNSEKDGLPEPAILNLSSLQEPRFRGSERTADDLERTLRGEFAKRGGDPSFILFLIPMGKTDEWRGVVSDVADYRLGIPSKKVRIEQVHLAPQECVAILENIAQEIAATLGVTNFYIKNMPESFMEEPTMVIALKIEYGMIFVTASMDTSYFRYQARYARNYAPGENQDNPEEEIKPSKLMSKKVKNEGGLRQCLRELLGSFYTGRVLPQRLIIYKDTAPSSYSSYNDEANLIKMITVEHFKDMHSDPQSGLDDDGRKQLGEDLENWDPQLIAIAVNSNSDKSVYDDNNEIQPGTVVDAGIVRVDIKAFDIISHKRIRGTPSFTTYTVVRDDCNFTMTALETLTFYLSNLYGKCPRGVHVVVPLYYCSLLANRVVDAHFVKPQSRMVLGFRKEEDEMGGGGGGRFGAGRGGGRFGGGRGGGRFGGGGGPPPGPERPQWTQYTIKQPSPNLLQAMYWL